MAESRRPHGRLSRKQMRRSTPADRRRRDWPQSAYSQPGPRYQLLTLAGPALSCRLPDSEPLAEVGYKKQPPRARTEPLLQVLALQAQADGSPGEIGMGALPAPKLSG